MSDRIVDTSIEFLPSGDRMSDRLRTFINLWHRLVLVEQLEWPRNKSLAHLHQQVLESLMQQIGLLQTREKYPRKKHETSPTA